MLKHKYFEQFFPCTQTMKHKQNSTDGKTENRKDWRGEGVWEILRTELFRGERGGEVERSHDTILRLRFLRLRFLPWWERRLDYSPSDWPEPSMIPTCDCYICLGAGGRKEVEADSECYGEDGGGELGTPSQRASTRSSLKLLPPLYARWHGA